MSDRDFKARAQDELNQLRADRLAPHGDFWYALHLDVSHLLNVDESRKLLHTMRDIEKKSSNDLHKKGILRAIDLELNPSLDHEPGHRTARRNDVALQATAAYDEVVAIKTRAPLIEGDPRNFNELKIDVNKKIVPESREEFVRQFNKFSSTPGFDNSVKARLIGSEIEFEPRQRPTQI